MSVVTYVIFQKSYEDSDMEIVTDVKSEHFYQILDPLYPWLNLLKSNAFFHVTLQIGSIFQKKTEQVY